MITLFACGDIVNHRHPDGRICSEEMARLIGSADYAMANFEAPISGFGSPQPKSGPHISQRAETVQGLKEQGINHLLLANNHMLDFGSEGLGATLREIERVGLDHSGAGLDFRQAYKPFVTEIKGVRIGLVSAGEAQFGVLDHFLDADQAGYAWINHDRIDKAVISLRAECDVVLVFSHAGLEHYPIPQEEWRRRYRHLCDLGADAVIGSHPHVPQGYEVHSGSLIFYSLGNFYFDSRKSPSRENRTYSVLLTLEPGRPVSFQPIFHHVREGRVDLSPEDRKIDLDLLCAMLGDTYRERHDAMSLEVYEDKVKKGLFPYDTTLPAALRLVFSNFFNPGKRIDKEIDRLHLLRNEAYYYATRRALELRLQGRGPGC